VKSLRKTLLGITGLMALVASFAPPARSQQDSSKAADASVDNFATKLDEIVVTAQKRGQNLQDVALAVTAFNEQTLINAGVQSIAELDQLDPSLSISQDTGAVIPTLRGIGNPAANFIGNEASVPVYIDDVYYTRLSPDYLQLANIERVEVLKGPQGTLFGRNASGGAIQIYTRDPSDTPVAEGKIGYGTYGTVSGQGYVSGPLADNVRADLSVSALHQEQGWGRYVVSGYPTGLDRFVNLRSKLVADLTDTTHLRLITYYVHSDTGQAIGGDRVAGTIGGTPIYPPYGPVQPLPALPGFYDSPSTFPSQISHEGWGGSMNLDQNLGFADFVSISAFRKAIEHYIGSDGDGSSFDFLTYNPTSLDRQFSEELQLKSRADSQVAWIVGAYYLDSRQGYDPTTINGDAITSQGFSALEIFGMQDIRSKAGYSQATFPVAGKTTNLTLGLRYTSDNVHGIGTQEAVVPGVGQFPAQTPYNKVFTFDKVTFKVSADHKFTDDIMSYVSYSRGFKSGTFNTLPLDADPTKPETVDAVELGLKSEFFDHRWRFNAAVFQNKIRDPQVSTIIAQGTSEFVGLTNAQDARVRGVEFNVEAAVVEGLTLRLGGTYLDAKFTSFTDAPLYYPNLGPPYGLQAPVQGNASGNPLPYVPSWRSDVGLTYETDDSLGNFTFDADVAYTGNYSFNADDFVNQRSYTLLNSSLNYKPSPTSRWNVRVWGKNLTGAKYYTEALEVTGGAGNLSGAAPPRTAGVEFGIKL
jgi:iron complex outermembrane recepter protein